MVGFEIEVRTNGGRRKELFGELSLKELVEEALKRSSKGEEEARRFWEGFEVSEEFGRELLKLLLEEATKSLKGEGYSFFLEKWEGEVKVVCRKAVEGGEVLLKKGYPLTLYRALNANGAKGILKILETMVESLERLRLQ